MCNDRNDRCMNPDTIDLWIARSSCPINCRIVSESFQIIMGQGIIRQYLSITHALYIGHSLVNLKLANVAIIVLTD